MIPEPTSFPVGNSHRVAHFFPQQPVRDFERLEEILADAIAAAREAMARLDTLPQTLWKPIEAEARALRAQIGKRRLLSDDFRHAAEAILRRLARADIPEDAAEIAHLAAHRLRDALNLSHRVADLIAAERDIGWHRGIRD